MVTIGGIVQNYFLSYTVLLDVLIDVLVWCKSLKTIKSSDFTEETDPYIHDRFCFLEEEALGGNY